MARISPSFSREKEAKEGRLAGFSKGFFQGRCSIQKESVLLTAKQGMSMQEASFPHGLPFIKVRSMHTTTDVIVIGAGITGLTTAFHAAQRGKRVWIVETKDRAGGQIRTFSEQGFTFESGPNTGVVSYPEVAELFQALAPRCQLETACEHARRRLVWKGERFHALPAGPLGALTTPLFTLYDKFRILGEPFRAKGTDPDETVGRLAERRLGRSFLHYAVDPFLSGIYAGDPQQLITRYALPKLYRLEQEHGSFVRGAIAKARMPKSERDRLATKQVFSAIGGLGHLVDALVQAIGSEHLHLGATQVKVSPLPTGGWQVNYQTNGRPVCVQAPYVVTTTGAYALPDLLPFVPANEMKLLSCLTYAPVVQVSVGIRHTGNLHFNAFGGLVPSCEQRKVLGILYPSCCFGGRAPEGGMLFSFFLGGVKHPEWLQRSDAEIQEGICRELHAMLKFPEGTVPDLIRIFRHPHAIPQYGSGSGERLACIERLQQQYPGLMIGGNLKSGIGLADRIRQGTEMARALL